jgi:hypothetical protein
MARPKDTISTRAKTIGAKFISFSFGENFSDVVLLPLVVADFA